MRAGELTAIHVPDETEEAGRQQFDRPPLQRAFEASLFALEEALPRQAELDKEVEALATRGPYREPVG